AESVSPLITAKAVQEMAELAAGVHVDRSVLSYVTRIAEETRSVDGVQLGVSVRGALAHVRAAKTRAVAAGRTYVVPDDVTARALGVLAHRIGLSPEAEFSGTTVSQVLGRILTEIKPPTERGDALVH